jgi:hypothetical protein
MKCGPHWSAGQNLNTHRNKGDKTTAWIGDQVRLKLPEGCSRVLYTGGGTASY